MSDAQSREFEEWMNTVAESMKDNNNRGRTRRLSLLAVKKMKEEMKQEEQEEQEEQELDGE